MHTVLLLEDDKDIRKIYSDSLKALGIEVVETDSAEEALQILTSQPINLLVMDIVLPKGMSGLDMLRKAKNIERVKELPVVVVTNYDSERQKATELGVNEFVLKASSNPREIAEKIAKLLKEK